MTLYLDTSSLVKLYIAETGTDTVRELVQRATIVATSVITYAETRAAFARRHREGALRHAAFALAKRSLEEDWPAYLSIDVTKSMCREGGDLAEQYELRGYDSVQLASFLHLARRAGTSVPAFSSFDDRLNRAAKAALRGLARSRRPAGV